MKNSFLYFCILFFFILNISCNNKKPSDLELRKVLSSYFDAVNTNNYQGMASSLSYYDEILGRFGEVGASKVAFNDAVDKINKQYESDRESGVVNFDKFGIVAVRILGLGRGLYYTTEEFSTDDNNGYLILRHTFNYDEMDFSVFPKGTKLYFLGCPLGKIYKITTGVPIELERSYIIELKSKWFFKKDFDNKWKISKMEVLDSAVKCKRSYSRIY